MLALKISSDGSLQLKADSTGRPIEPPLNSFNYFTLTGRTKKELTVP